MGRGKKFARTLMWNASRAPIRYRCALSCLFRLPRYLASRDLRDDALYRLDWNSLKHTKPSRTPYLTASPNGAEVYECAVDNLV